MLLRAGLVLVCRPENRETFPLVHLDFEIAEQQNLEKIAHEVVIGHGIAEFSRPTMDQEPFFPLLAGLVLHWSGANRSWWGDTRYVLALNILFDLLTGLLLYRLALSRYGPRVALIAAALWLCYPPAMLYAVQFLPDSLFVFLLVLTIYLYDRLEASGWSWKKSLLLGIVLGLLTLTKTFGLLVAFAYFVYIVLIRYETVRRTRIKAAFLVLSALLLVIVPWMARNYHYLGDPSLTSRPHAGLVSSEWAAKPGWDNRLSQLARLWNTDLATFEIAAFDERQPQHTPKALVIDNSPPDSIELHGGGLYHYYIVWLVVVSLIVFPYIGIVLLGTAGFYLVPHFGTRGLLILVLLLTGLTAIFTVGVPRDHFVCMPLLILSSCSLFGRWSWSSAPEWRRISLLLALGMFAGVWVNELTHWLDPFHLPTP